MSIRWIRNVEVDGKPATLEILLGWSKIADKCYIRVGDEEEYWFHHVSAERAKILLQGHSLLRRKLEGHRVQTTAGSAYAWN